MYSARASDSLRSEIEMLKLQLANKDQQLKALSEEKKEEIWKRVEIVIDGSPFTNSLKQMDQGVKGLMEMLEGYTCELRETVANCELNHPDRMTIETLRENLKNIVGFMETKEAYWNQQLGSLEKIVSDSQNGQDRGLPSFMKHISLENNLSLISPTLLCTKLKEEYENLHRE